MNDADGTLDNSVVREAWIDVICDRFEQLCRSHRRVSIAAFLQNENIDPATADPELISEMRKVEAAYQTPVFDSATLARYKLVNFHAKGGMGQVSVYYDKEMQRRVAFKELLPGRVSDPASLNRFLQEARITGRLEHPSIVPVYELVKPAQGYVPFYTMRFVNGRTLTEAIRDYHRKRQVGTSVALDMLTLLNAFVSVCQTIAYAHTQGVIHRDLKGSNVMLGDYGEVIVLDWGLAKVIGTEDPPNTLYMVQAYCVPEDSSFEDAIDLQYVLSLPGDISGTPGYLSPEQANGRSDLIVPQTDVYGLGAILYEILTGQPPFTGKDVWEILKQVKYAEPLRPSALVSDVPAGLEAVCLRALAKSPSDRFATATELASEIQRWLAESADRDRAVLERERFFNLSLDLLCTVGADLHFKQLNPAWETSLGWSREELMSRPYLEFLHPDDREKSLSEVKLFFQGKGRVTGSPLENRHRCKDGSYLWFSWSGSWIEGEKLVYAVGRDITEMKNAEIALLRSKERFELAVRGSGDGLWDWDHETGESYYSPQWKSMIGYEEHEITHDIVEWESRLHPDDRDRAIAAVRSCTEGDKSAYEVEYRFRHKDGSYRWILDRGVAIRNATGVIRMAGSHTDITERKRMEQELRDSEQHHQAAIAELTAELARCRDRVSRI